MKVLSETIIQIKDFAKLCKTAKDKNFGTNIVESLQKVQQIKAEPLLSKDNLETLFLFHGKKVLINYYVYDKDQIVEEKGELCVHEYAKKDFMPGVYLRKSKHNGHSLPFLTENGGYNNHLGIFYIISKKGDLIYDARGLLTTEKNHYVKFATIYGKESAYLLIQKDIKNYIAQNMEKPQEK